MGTKENSPFSKARSTPYKLEIFGYVYCPIAKIDFRSRRINGWIEMIMIVDTGADYKLAALLLCNGFGHKLEEEI